MFKLKNKEEKPLSNRQLRRLALENQALLFMKLNKWASTIEKLVENSDEIVELAKSLQDATPEEKISAILANKKDGE